MTVTTLESTNDGYIRSGPGVAGDWDTIRGAGIGLLARTSQTTTYYPTVGTQVSGGTNYYVYQMPLMFDASALVGRVATAVDFRLKTKTYTSPDFQIDIRQYVDFGVIGAEDWVSAFDLGTYPVLGSFNGSAPSSAIMTSVCTNAALLAYVNSKLGGKVPFLLTSALQLAAGVPAGDGYRLQPYGFPSSPTSSPELVLTHEPAPMGFLPRFW